MFSPHRYLSRVGNIGQPLPDPFLSLGVNRVQFRRGATSMIAGAPGSFKSVFALNMLVQWAGSGIGCLYVSADSDEFTVVRRLSGILTGVDLETVESSLLAGGGVRERFESVLRDNLEGAEFDYSQLDLNGIARQVRAYEAVYGMFPEVIFVDNLIDVVDSPDDWGGMLMMTRELDGLAREIKAHICILHHAKLPNGSQSQSPGYFKPPADWEIQGKITQIPRLVLTMAAQGLNLKVACIKNTNGPASRDGSMNYGFQVLSSMQVREFDFSMGRI